MEVVKKIRFQKLPKSIKLTIILLNFAENSSRIEEQEKEINKNWY